MKLIAEMAFPNWMRRYREHYPWGRTSEDCTYLTSPNISDTRNFQVFPKSVSVFCFVFSEGSMDFFMRVNVPKKRSCYWIPDVFQIENTNKRPMNEQMIHFWDKLIWHSPCNWFWLYSNTKFVFWSNFNKFYYLKFVFFYIVQNNIGIKGKNGSFLVQFFAYSPQQFLHCFQRFL